MGMFTRVRTLIRWTSVLLLALLVVTPLTQIIMRGVLNMPMAGAEELARYFLICLCFIGASYVSAEGGQISQGFVLLFDSGVTLLKMQLF